MDKSSINEPVSIAMLNSQSVLMMMMMMMMMRVTAVAL